MKKEENTDSINFIEVYDNLIPVDICDSLISLFEREIMMENSKVFRGATTSGVNDNYKKCLELPLSRSDYSNNEFYNDLDFFLKKAIFKYNKKYKLIASQLNTDLLSEEHEKNNSFFMENEDNFFKSYGRFTRWRMKKYFTPDDSYQAWHADWGKPPELIQRMVSVLIYLNDVEEGGETEFYHQKIKVKPKKGRLVLFPSFYTHIHRGNKPISNDKYIIVGWITESPLQ